MTTTMLIATKIVFLANSVRQGCRTYIPAAFALKRTGTLEYTDMGPFLLLCRLIRQTSFSSISTVPISSFIKNATIDTLSLFPGADRRQFDSMRLTGFLINAVCRTAFVATIGVHPNKTELMCLPRYNTSRILPSTLKLEWPAEVRERCRFCKSLAEPYGDVSFIIKFRVTFVTSNVAIKWETPSLPHIRV